MVIFLSRMIQAKPEKTQTSTIQTGLAASLCLYYTELLRPVSLIERDEHRFGIATSEK